MSMFSKGGNWLRWLVNIVEAVDAGSVPAEEVVKHVVPQTGSCVCLPTRCKAGGHSHPCAICDSPSGG
eukprot:4827145-Ditylum_brightwellii.AAC.1